MFFIIIICETIMVLLLTHLLSVLQKHRLHKQERKKNVRNRKLSIVKWFIYPTSFNIFFSSSHSYLYGGGAGPQIACSWRKANIQHLFISPFVRYYLVSAYILKVDCCHKARYLKALNYSLAHSLSFLHRNALDKTKVSKSLAQRFIWSFSKCSPIHHFA